MFDLTRLYFGDLEVGVSNRPHESASLQTCIATVKVIGSPYEVSLQMTQKRLRGHKKIRKGKLACAWHALRMLEGSEFGIDWFAEHIYRYPRDRHPQRMDQILEVIEEIKPHLPLAIADIKRKLGVDSAELEGRVFGGGNQDKQWREEEVDSDLKDAWLERLNSISPNIQFINVCAGGVGHVSLSPYFSFNFGNPENLPITWSDEKREDFARFIHDWFSDIAKVKVEDWFPHRDWDGSVASFPDQEPYVWYFNIYAPRPRVMMNQAAFEDWWERVIARFEQLPRAIPGEFT